MAQNKGANVRYRAIDKCLSAKHGRYSWEDLQRACEDALYRAFSERISVSRRQIFNDLNFMESEAGFRARKGQSVKGSAISMVLNRWRGNGKIEKITESTWKKL